MLFVVGFVAVTVYVIDAVVVVVDLIVVIVVVIVNRCVLRATLIILHINSYTIVRTNHGILPLS